jgi:hypothetical protein
MPVPCRKSVPGIISGWEFGVAEELATAGFDRSAQATFTRHARSAELPKGKTTFNSIALKGATINFPGYILYDGKYVDVADQEEERNGYILTSAIYRTTGSGGKVVSEDILQNSDDVTEYLVDGTSLLGSNFYGTTVGFWKYPKSKKETNAIVGFSGPIGIALSK